MFSPVVIHDDENNTYVEGRIWLYFKPEHEITPPEDDKDWPQTLHAHAVEMSQWLHDAAYMAEQLLNDGWDLELTLYDISCTLTNVPMEEMRRRLRKLGIKLEDCEVIDYNAKPAKKVAAKGKAKKKPAVKKEGKQNKSTKAIAK